MRVITLTTLMQHHFLSRRFALFVARPREVKYRGLSLVWLWIKAYQLKDLLRNLCVDGQADQVLSRLRRDGKIMSPRAARETLRYFPRFLRRHLSAEQFLGESGNLGDGFLGLVRQNYCHVIDLTENHRLKGGGFLSV